jgi:hypothetical protein
MERCCSLDVFVLIVSVLSGFVRALFATARNGSVIAFCVPPSGIVDRVHKGLTIPSNADGVDGERKRAVYVTVAVTALCNAYDVVFIIRFTLPVFNGLIA